LSDFYQAVVKGANTNNQNELNKSNIQTLYYETVIKMLELGKALNWKNNFHQFYSTEFS